MSIWTRKQELSGRGAAIEGLCTAPVMQPNDIYYSNQEGGEKRSSIPESPRA